MNSSLLRVASLSVAVALGHTAFTHQAIADAPKVVATIKPIHALVASVMDGVGAPSLMVKGNASPHAFSMRPSDAAALSAAEIVFWVGPEFETFLRKPMETLAKSAHAIALSEVPGVALLPYREGGAWEGHAAHEDHGHAKHDHDHKGHDHDHGKHDHDKHDHGSHDHGKEHAKEAHDHDKHEHGEHGHDAHGHGEHAHGEFDMHIWLDPDNSKAMLDAIAEELGEHDPANTARYNTNAEQAKARIAAMDKDLKRQLGPIRNHAYVVFHDAYQYFERHYELSPVGSITVGPDRLPGARRLYEIRKKVINEGAICVFSEPQFEPAMVNSILEGTPARAGQIDPLGASLTAGKDAHDRLLRNLARDLLSCLQPSS